MNKLVIPISFLLFLISCKSEVEVTEPAHSDSSDDTLNVFVEDTLVEESELIEIDYDQYYSLAYGYANSRGEKLMMLEKPDGTNPESYEYAINKSGTLSRIESLGHQESNEDDTHRDNQYNFENTEGYLFTMNDGIADEWASTLFLTEEFKGQRVLLSAGKKIRADLEAVDINRIETEKVRKFKSHSLVNFYEGFGSLYFVEFEKENDSCLVSLAWITTGQITYLDFPAKYDEMSTWRVDDGGVFDFSYYNVIAVFDSNNGIEIMTDWTGAEGSSINYLLAVGSSFESVGGAYRYQAPN
ncbi:MAG: hypothetical protein ACI857_002859 [Arenicella sp.]|jgi:hypothetical protein